MSAEEIGIIILLILVVVGPQRLPEYAEQLAKLVRNVKQMATGATQSIRDELGDELGDVDFSKFDPRQYDPRRIVREALLDDIVPATKSTRSRTSTRTKPVSSGGPAAVGAAAGAVAAAAGAGGTSDETRGDVEDAAVATLPRAPFDDEAT